MSEHSAPRQWRVRATLRKIIALPAAFIVIIAVALAAGFMATSARAATVATSGDQDCTYEWVREIPQSHQEYKYSKTIPAVPGVMEYKYKKSVTDYETEYRFLYQKKVKGDVYKKKDGSTEKVGTFDFEWFEAPTWNGGPLTHWGDWGYDANTEEEGPHNATSNSYQVDGKTYVKKSTYYTYFKTEQSESREIDTGSHFEYSGWTTEIREFPWVQIDERWKTEPQPEQTVLYKDGAWTTDTPGSPWVKVDERTVSDEPIKQGPVRSAEAPPLNYDGVNSNVAWTKVPGSEVCPPEEPVINPKASLTSVCEVLAGEKTGYTVVNSVLDNTGSNEEVVFGVVETIDGVTEFSQIPVAAGKKLTPQVRYSQEDGKKVSLVINARDVMQDSLSFETATCAATVTPPTPPTKTCPAGTKWIDLNHNGKVDTGECTTPVKPKPPVVKPPVKPVVTAPPVVMGPRVETDGGASGPSGFVWIALLGASALIAAGLRRTRTARR